MENKTVETLLGKLRREFKPRIPKVLENLNKIKLIEGKITTASGNSEEIYKLFPNTYGQKIIDFEINNNSNNIKKKEEEKKNDNECLLRVGVVLSGGQASGGHNVITGLFDSLKELNASNELIGFLNGPIGVIENKYIVLNQEIIDKYRNTGGFDIIKSGRDKIQSDEQLKKSLNTIISNKLNGLVIIGGDDSNTNAAVLSEYFLSNLKNSNNNCCVIGVPKTIDGDLQNEYIEISFGFDTAVKTYSHMISNIARDSISAAKAWHFIKLMGRDASHVTLDCSIQTQPNITLIGEEIQSENYLLHDITEKMCEIIMERAIHGKNYGIALIPEGVISFIPSMKALISDLNDMLKNGSKHLEIIENLQEMSDKISYVREQLSKISLTNLKNFDVLPRDIQSQLLLERDPHGNIQMSQIPIEQLFILIVESKLKKNQKWKKLGCKFRGQGHFFGYDGRSGFPSNFDAQYCYALGRGATLLINHKKNGYMARIYNLENDVTEWKAGGIPITMLMNMELRHGKSKPVIKKALVDVEKGKKFSYFLKKRYDWQYDDCYRYVGPIQFFGPTELTDTPPMNVLINKTNDIKWPVDKNNKNNNNKK